jgi:hypothetical protein
MRTTLDIDEDVLAAAKDIAQAERRTVGQVVSELVRKAVTTPSYHRGRGLAEPAEPFDARAWPTFPDRPGPPVTSVLIERIQQELDREDATPWDHAADKPRE